MTTQRWNDEMLDSLADRVSEISSEVQQTTHNVDMLVGAVSTFLERDRERSEEFRQHQEEFRQHQLEYEQYKRENDQRFYNLLEEVRFLIRQLGQDEG